MLLFLVCVIFVYIVFRGSCAILYDGCGWVLQRFNPDVCSEEEETKAGYGSTVFFWICILLLSVLAWKLLFS
jgi:hypothetical protein